MKRREFLLGLPAAAHAAPAEPRRPNLLFVLADQWRPQTLPCAGDRDLHAPHLTKFGKEAVQFTRTYASNPVCTPSRSSIVTGKFPRACRMPHNDLLLPLEERCIAQELKNSGYRTGYIGKWHMDGEGRPGFVPPGVHRRGFEYWAAFNRGHFYYNSTYYRDKDEPIHMDGFEPDYQTDLAIDFIKSNREHPFYLYVSWGPPHTPRKAPPRYANFYKPGQFTLPPNVPKAYEQTAREDRPGYYGLCSGLDDNMGRLLATLDETGLAEDTIVVFTADHGDMLGSQGLEFKGVPYEESARIPLLVRYPRKLQGGGRSDDLLISNVDYMPTILTLCGTPIPPTVQGRDLAPQLLGGKQSRPEIIYSEGRLETANSWHMVVTHRHKLVVNKSMEVTHLFDVGEDPYEMHNLVKDAGRAKTQAELLPELRTWYKKAGGSA